ncbi:MAG: hypothetical protein JXO72_09050 [Vicinamibacteria bacterium]|nr:hypothetical protein [Vicinamibacteria bacterium]
MRLLKAWKGGVLLLVAASTLIPGCRRKPKEINAIVPGFAVNRVRAPLGSAIEVTYTWTCEPTMKKLDQDYRAFVHFVDTHGYTLFTDDHMPAVPVSTWEPGQAYSYQRTVFVPLYPYVGEVEVRVGLESASTGRGRVALKGDDAGLREFRVEKMELLPQTENIYLVQKEGWHTPETDQDNPSIERTWTKKDAVLSFKNPGKDVIFYLEADTNFKAFAKPPVLRVSVGNVGVMMPIESSELFMKKIRFNAEHLGSEEWVDLTLALDQSFIPKDLGINEDERELGLNVYHRFIVEASEVGELPADDVLDAAPLGVASKTAVASKAK